MKFTLIITPQSRHFKRLSDLLKRAQLIKEDRTLLYATLSSGLDGEHAEPTAQNEARPNKVTVQPRSRVASFIGKEIQQ